MPKTTIPAADVLFAALSDRTRLRLLSLMRAGEVCVCDLVGALAIPQPTASRHLAILRRAGFVVVRKQGLWSYYALAEPHSALQAKLLESLASCAGESPGVGRDVARLSKVRKARGCCE